MLNSTESLLYYFLFGHHRFKSILNLALLSYKFQSVVVINVCHSVNFIYNFLMALVYLSFKLANTYFYPIFKNTFGCWARNIKIFKIKDANSFIVKFSSNKLLKKCTQKLYAAMNFRGVILCITFTTFPNTINTASTKKGLKRDVRWLVFLQNTFLKNQ